MSIKSRRYSSRDKIKLQIISYMFEKECNSLSSKYELLHHSGIGMYDYPYLDRILSEMEDTLWIKVSYSGVKSKKKHYSLDLRGQELMQFLQKLDDNSPLFDLDLFS
ncbi:hypothetical protein SCCGRSA3_02036 [Marine Group I thaumarchaeote SCGC RSA3]|uniref:Transcriptional regulator PadR family protein n=2 Tax=Marine Group I TaxID=905826 RepID=A0A081RMX4_9ARCH|nr:hypothetical protein AAA799N04_01039 [Marine Group I thaumarchaeote SCGC AAA799-N04]KFM16833.1 hypothetical protein SCCGRSA3_02036 [Marine Group I thaumarchaeote SCGC RSA3]